MAQAATHSHVTAQPRKLFYRINEVSRMMGLKSHVLRYWETEFSELAPEKDASDQRRYRQKDIDTLAAIRKLLYEDRYTIKGARPKLKSEMRRMRAEGESNRVPERAVEAAPPKVKTARRKPNKRLGETLYHLRSEVDDLIKILGA